MGLSYRTEIESYSRSSHHAMLAPGRPGSKIRTKSGDIMIRQHDRLAALTGPATHDRG